MRSSVFTFIPKQNQVESKKGPEIFTKTCPYWPSYRCKCFPEVQIGLRCLGNPRCPRNEHDKRPGCERERRREPRVRKSVEDLLVVDVEHDVQRPPRRKIDTDFHLLRRNRSRILIRDLDVYRLRSVCFVGLALKTQLFRSRSQSFQGSETFQRGKMKRLLSW